MAVATVVVAAAVITVAAIVAEVTGIISVAGTMAAAIFMRDRHTVSMPDPHTAHSPPIA
jgi:hypothetical protein